MESNQIIKLWLIRIHKPDEQRSTLWSYTYASACKIDRELMAYVPSSPSDNFLPTQYLQLQEEES